MQKYFDPGRTRTCNPLIRSQMPYPLGHRTMLLIVVVCCKVDKVSTELSVVLLHKTSEQVGSLV